MALTWRNVDGPDFGRSLEGIRTFSSLFGDAVGGLQRGLDRYDGTLDRRANNQLLMQFAGIQEADDAKAALADLGSNPNAGRFNAATIGAVTGRPTELLAQATGELGLERGQYQFADMKRRDANDQALGDVLPAFYNAPDRAAFMRDNAAAFRGQGGRVLSEVLSGGQNYELGNVNIAGARQNQTFGAENQGWTREDRNLNIQAETAAAKYGAIADPLDREAAIRADLVSNPRLMGRVLAASGISSGTLGGGGAVDDLIGSAIGGADGGGGGGKFTYAAPQKELASSLSGLGYSPTVVAAALGNAHVEGGYTGKQGDGGSAGGVFQWRADRRANFTKLLGVDPAKATPAQAAKFFDWEMKNPGKAGMTVQQRDAILAAKTPEQAAALIDQHYERSDGKARAARMAMASQAAMALGGVNATLGTNRSRAAVNMDTMAREFGAVVNGPPQTPGQAAASLLADPSFKGRTQEEMLKQIDLVQTYARSGKNPMNIPPAVAALIIKNAPNADKGWWFGTEAFGGGPVSEKGVNSLVDRYKSGEFDEAVRANAALEINSGQRQQAEQTLQRAQQAVAMGQQMARAGRTVNMGRLTADLQAAQQIYQAALQAEQGGGSFGSPGDLQEEQTMTAGSQPRRPVATNRAAAAIDQAAARPGPTPAAPRNSAAGRRERLYNGTVGAIPNPALLLAKGFDWLAR